MRTPCYNEPRYESPSVTVFSDTTTVTAWIIHTFFIPRLRDAGDCAYIIFPKPPENTPIRIELSQVAVAIAESKPRLPYQIDIIQADWIGRQQIAKPIINRMTHKLIANKDTTTPVVVFRVEQYAGLAIVRTLGRMGVKVYCIDHDRNALGMMSRYCAGRFYWDTDSSPPDATVRFLVDVARKIGQKAILLPTFDTRNLLVDQYRSELSKWFLLPQPKPGAMRLLYSKKSLYELCKSEGVPTAETIFPGSIEQAIDAGKVLGFPVVIKAIDGDRMMHRLGCRMGIVRNEAELHDTYNKLDEPGVQNLALQEFISRNVDDVWMLSAYFDTNGVCRFAITGRKLRQLPIHGGVTSFGICASCEPVVENICRVAKAAAYQGIIDADFIYDKRDGLYKLLDVNPRPGANFRLFVDKHGLDVVRSLYLDLTGQNVPPVEPSWGRKFVVEDKDLQSLRDLMQKDSIALRDWFNSMRGASELAHIVSDDFRPSIAFVKGLVWYYTRGILKRLLKLISWSGKSR